MLTDLQKKQVAAWLESGLSIAQLQTKISEEFGISMTYMDVRFLVDDLGLELKETAPAAEKNAVPAGENAPAENSGAVPADAPSAVPAGTDENAATEPKKTLGGVSLGVDAIQIPGVIASGDVTFSDGVRGKWLIDQSGRPGLAEFPEGYRPPAADIPEFQQKLVAELRKLGLA